MRWAESIEKFKQEEKTLAGDTLLTASYLSYVGCFGRKYRMDLLETKWIECLKTVQVQYIPCNGIFSSVQIFTKNLNFALGEIL